MKPNYKKSKIKKESKKYEESQFMSIYQTLDPGYKVKIMSLKANQNNVIESKSKKWQSSIFNQYDEIKNQIN